MAVLRQRLPGWVLELGLAAALAGSGAVVAEWLSRQFRPPASTLLIGLLVLGLAGVGLWLLGEPTADQPVSEQPNIGGIAGGVGYITAMYLLGGQPADPLTVGLLTGVSALLYWLGAILWIRGGALST